MSPAKATLLNLLKRKNPHIQIPLNACKNTLLQLVDCTEDLGSIGLGPFAASIINASPILDDPLVYLDSHGLKQHLAIEKNLAELREMLVQIHEPFAISYIKSSADFSLDIYEMEIRKRIKYHINEIDRYRDSIIRHCLIYRACKSPTHSDLYKALKVVHSLIRSGNLRPADAAALDIVRTIFIEAGITLDGKDLRG